MMKSKYHVLVLLLLSVPTFAQVGIGTTAPDSSAMLEVYSTSKGVLIPRLTVTQRNSISTPATGLLIYQTNSSPGFYYYDGSSWECLATCSSAGLSGTEWRWDGPTGGDTMTTGDTMVVESDGSTPLYFKVDGDFSGLIDAGRTTTTLGHSTGLSFATAHSNTFLGDSAAYQNERGSVNTFIGKNSGHKNKHGFKNVAVGFFSGPDLDSTYNTIAIGADIKVNEHNTAVIGNGEVKRWGFGSVPGQGKAFTVGSDTSNGNGAYLTKGGDWTNGSSRFFKKEINPVHTGDVLNRVAKLNIYSWKYKGSNDLHIGPIAEEFYALFGTGQDGQHISTIDPAGVSLAAIKQLYEQQQALEKKLADYEALLKQQQAQIELLQSKW